MPPKRTFLEDDPFWFCINPKDQWKDHYKVVQIKTTSCVNNAHTKQMIVNGAAEPLSSTAIQSNINGAHGWEGQLGNSNGMGFSSVIDENWRKGKDTNIVCSGDTVIQYIGLCEEQIYRFPLVQNWGSFAHGLCVMGASEVTTTNNKGYSYTNVGPLQNGVQMHGDQPNTWTQINHSQVCKGGIYLQPATLEGPQPGTHVYVNALAHDQSNGVTFCALIKEVTDNVGSGRWEELLMDDGFTRSSMLADNYRGYCKTIKEQCTSEEYADSTFQGTIEIDTRATLKLFL